MNRRASCLGMAMVAAAAALWPTSAETQSSAAGILVYFGTYTAADKSKGIYASRFNTETGALTTPELVAEARNPSYLTLHPDGNHLYAVSEVNDVDGKPGGAVLAYRVDRASGKLALLNQQSSRGGGPAHVTIDSRGRYVVVSNYGGGSVAALPVARDGSLQPATGFVQHEGTGANPERQKGPHAHSATLNADDRLAYVADLGLDKVMIYRLDADKGTLTANTPPSASVEPAAGPRHFAFGTGGRFAYVINEMNCTITAFSVDAKTGGLTAVQTVSTLPEGATVKPGYSTADVQVHRSGRFLYGSNRGHDSIAVYSIDEKTGRLALLQHIPTGGSTPRAFGLDPSGNFLLAANQRSDSVVVFRIDQKTGRLSSTGTSISLGAPVCVRFLPPAR